MSSPALVKQSDLKRMADVAKAKGVTVWIEVNGRRVGVSPDIPKIHSPDELDVVEEVRL
ncbi:hypothetical protein [Rhizobium terrae]|uniref:hypothetical protein n=1 Tax=Rhizobium terrae TaxID=2171756 RepID=UPI0013C2F6A5|nr:hypothetical protein [Rhizobium terrae]